MNIAELATIGGFVITIGGVLIMFGSLKNKLETTCERQKEDRDQNRDKFQELYTSRNTTNEAIVKLSTLVEQISKETAQINDKIDKALEK